MTSELVKETASTSEPQFRAEQTAATGASPAQDAVGARRRGLWLAGLVLWALLTGGTAGTAPISSYRRKRDEAVAESSTAEVERDPEVLEQVRKLFEQGASEFFQDGVYSAFSQALLVFLARYGRTAFQAIAEYLFSGAGNPDVVSEALRWLADFDDPKTLPQRWAILQRTLYDRSPRVRDGAILGFAALDDPNARALLLESQKTEPIPELRRLIEQVVEQLNATHAPPPATSSRESLA